MGIFRRQRVDPDLSPQQREERIKELRRKREARMRVLAVRSVLLAGGLVLALVVLGYWLLTTVGGRDFLLAQIVARLPADAELSWSRAEGPPRAPCCCTTCASCCRASVTRPACRPPTRRARPATSCSPRAGR